MDIDPPTHNQPSLSRTHSEGVASVPLTSSSILSLEAAIRGLRSRAVEPGEREGDSQSEDSGSEGASAEERDEWFATMGANLYSPHMAGEDQDIEPDLTEDLDEDGLLIHQRLTETFERELVDACKSCCVS